MAKVSIVASPRAGRQEHLSRIRRGRMLTLLLGVLVIAGGLAAGVISRRLSDAPPSSATGTPPAAHPVTSQVRPPSAPIAHRHTFDLPAADIGNTAESPAIAVDSQGTIYLAWSAETSDDERTLWMSRSDDGGVTLSEPWVAATSPIHVAVSQSRGQRVERRMHLLPRLAAHGDEVVLSWIRGGAAREDVALLVARSQDRGETFSKPIAAHASDQARPSYCDMTVAEDGSVVCTWLDHRNRAQQAYVSILPPGENSFEAEAVVDVGADADGVCPCCSTEVAVDPDGTIHVAYRGKEDGYRDPWIATIGDRDSMVVQREPVVTPRWTFPGCPHDGPSIALLGGRRLVAWMDASEGRSRVYLTDVPVGSAPTQSAAIRTIDPPFIGTQEQPVLIADTASSPTRLHWVWVSTSTESQPSSESQPSGDDAHSNGTHGHGGSHSQPAEAIASGARRWLRHAVSTDGGRTFSDVQLIAPIENHYQSRPQLAVAPNGDLHVAFFELSESGKQLVFVRVATEPGAANSIARLDEQP